MGTLAIQPSPHNKMEPKRERTAMKIQCQKEKTNIKAATSGAASSAETIALLTTDEAMEAMKKSSKTLRDYKPPSPKGRSK